jgi:hypothetical protein
MRGPLVPAVVLLVLSGVLASGCGSVNADRNLTDQSKPSLSAVSGKWVSIQDCKAVEAIMATVEAGGQPDVRKTFTEMALGSQSQIQLTEDGTIAFLGGGREGTATCLR